MSNLFSPARGQHRDMRAERLRAGARRHPAWQASARALRWLAAGIARAARRLRDSLRGVTADDPFADADLVDAPWCASPACPAGREIHRRADGCPSGDDPDYAGFWPGDHDQPWWNPEGTIIGAGCEPEELSGRPASHDCEGGACACPCHLLPPSPDVPLPGQDAERDTGRSITGQGHQPDTLDVLIAAYAGWVPETARWQPGTLLPATPPQRGPAVLSPPRVCAGRYSRPRPARHAARLPVHGLAAVASA